MKRLAFSKMTGAGNDFIVIDQKDLPAALSKEDIVLLCDRKYGIGADGLMVVDGKAGTLRASRFSVDFYNADGLGGMLCGNGARCALAFVRDAGIIRAGSTVRFAFAGVDYSGEALADGRIRIDLDTAFELRAVKGLEAEGSTMDGWFVDLGSRHFVLDAAGIEESMSHGDMGDLPIAKFGPALRYHPFFAPHGVNVNFCSLKDGILRVRTWERGVEGETLACGTGSTASALVYALRALVNPPVRVRTRSGEDLIVDFDSPSSPTYLTLTGNARLVFSGSFSLPG